MSNNTQTETLLPFDPEKVGEGSSFTNAQHAAHGEAAVSAWYKSHGNSGDYTDEDANDTIPDCIVDLLHLAHSAGLDVEAILRCAKLNFLAETNGETVEPQLECNCHADCV